MRYAVSRPKGDGWAGLKDAVRLPKYLVVLGVEDVLNILAKEDYLASTIVQVTGLTLRLPKTCQPAYQPARAQRPVGAGGQVVLPALIVRSAVGGFAIG